MLKRIICAVVLLLLAGSILVAVVWPALWWLMLLTGALLALAAYDLLQTRHTILRNYPVIGHLRYTLEDFRHQVRQYFIQGDNEGAPFTHGQRALVYQRAKNVSDVLPFGTQQDVYAVGYEWINHALFPFAPATIEARVTIGGPACSQPYSASHLNISSMSFGALSSHAIAALNHGAAQGGFAHWTGEGGISAYHQQGGGDLVWQIGTGYFGCRTPEGRFDAAQFAEKAVQPQVKMIEIKLSQGAKPGGGGILPGAKVTAAIAAARDVQLGIDVISPPAHRAFTNPEAMLDFIAELRELSGGKPIGFKFCVGRADEFLTVCRAMQARGITPDFITVDGKEGGTGAAPFEFSNGLGTPLREGLIFVHNALTGAGLRDKIKIIASGKIITGLDMATKLAIGADLCNAARGMMFALGCIQARRCHADTCPTGIATHDPWRVNGLVVGDKAPRVAHYHHNTVHHFLKVLAAAGLHQSGELTPALVLRRIAPTTVRSYAELYDWLTPGALLDGSAPPRWQQAWEGKIIAAPELIAAA